MNDQSEKLYYSIGEIAKELDVNTSLIRFWEKEFDILKPKKNKKGNRLFTREDRQNLLIIYHLVKEKGYTLQGAKDRIKSDKKNVTSETEIINSLTSIKNFLLKIKEEL